jgi:recombination protein RecA
MGQGRDNAKIFIKENPEIAKEIEDQIRANPQKLVNSASSKKALKKESSIDIIDIDD